MERPRLKPGRLTLPIPNAAPSRDRFRRSLDQTLDGHGAGLKVNQVRPGISTLTADHGRVADGQRRCRHPA
jgi:hypothetical protein